MSQNISKNKLGMILLLSAPFAVFFATGPMKVLTKEDVSPLQIKLYVKEANFLVDLGAARIKTAKDKISLWSKEYVRASDNLKRASKLRNTMISGVPTINEADYLNYLLVRDKTALELSLAEDKLFELEMQQRVLEHRVVMAENGFFRK